MGVVRYAGVERRSWAGGYAKVESVDAPVKNGGSDRMRGIHVTIILAIMPATAQHGLRKLFSKRNENRVGERSQGVKRGN